MLLGTERGNTRKERENKRDRWVGERKQTMTKQQDTVCNERRRVRGQSERGVKEGVTERVTWEICRSTPG